MSRTRHKKPEDQASETFSAGAEDFNPGEFDPAMQQAGSEQVQSVAVATVPPETGHADRHAPARPKSYAATVAKKEPIKIPDPYDQESFTGPENSVRLLKEEPNRKAGFHGAWVIRFDKPPNEMVDEEGIQYSKERPHPVLKILKDAGFRWGFSDADGAGGWGQEWAEGHFTFAEQQDARKVLAKAAEMVGAKSNEQTVPM